MAESIEKKLETQTMNYGIEEKIIKEFKDMIRLLKVEMRQERQFQTKIFKEDRKNPKEYWKGDCES